MAWPGSDLDLDLLHRYSFLTVGGRSGSGSSVSRIEQLSSWRSTWLGSADIPHYESKILYYEI
jgi:hypothetical protein